MILTVGLSLYSKSDAAYFKESFESIYHSQKLKPDEIFIVYDGYVSVEIEKLVIRYQNEGIPIKIFRNSVNKGLTISLNKMISKCETKYFARMDTDDISEPERFSEQVNFLENNKSIDILGTCGVDIDKNNLVLGHRKVPSEFKDICKILPLVNPVIHPSVMFRMESLLTIGGYDAKYRTSQDYALWFESVAQGLKIHNLSTSLIRYRTDWTYLERKGWNYRWNDVKIKWEGIPKIDKRITLRVYALVPLLIYLIPHVFFRRLKKIDIRNL
jgi:glycosyltransferase EpsE